MKKFISTIVILILLIQISFAQSIEPTFEKQDDLVKATYYYDNGMVKEVGFFKNDKLHDQWISYNEKGKIKVVAIYKNGKKDGKWYMVGDDIIKEVTYKSNEIIKVKEVEEFEMPII